MKVYIVSQLYLDGAVEIRGVFLNKKDADQLNDSPDTYLTTHEVIKNPRVKSSSKDLTLIQDGSGNRAPTFSNVAFADTRSLTEDISLHGQFLLSVLDFCERDIPEFKHCFILENEICILTHSGGGNRDFFENAESRRKTPYCEPEGYIKIKGPWNSDLRKHPNYLRETEDSNTPYLIFYFSFPEKYKRELKIASTR